MANEIYNTSWWGTALDTARTAGTDPDFFGSQIKLLTSEQDSVVTNGDFSNGTTDWNFTSGATLTDLGAKITHTPTTGSIAQSNALVIGKEYKLTYEITEKITGGLKFNSAVITTIITSVGVHTKYFEADQTTAVFSRTDASNNDVTIDNISIQAVRCGLDPYGPELVTNGDFSNGSTGWSAVGTQNEENFNTFSNGKVTLVNDSTGSGIQQNGVVQNGKTYQVKIVVSEIVGNGFKVYPGQDYPITSVGTFTFLINATNSIFYLYRNQNNPQPINGATIDNVSVKELQDHVEAKKCLADWIHRTALKDLNN